MWRFTVIVAFLLTGIGYASAADSDIAPRGTLRAAYISTNMAHAVQDRATGAIRGPAADITGEIAKRLGVPWEIKPARGPEGVIEAVNSGAADIGFVAFSNARAGQAEFSQTYMRVLQTFVVMDSSPIKVVADVDSPGRKIVGVRVDSTTAYIKRTFKHAAVIEIDHDLGSAMRMLAAKEADAFASNRARAETLAAETPGTRALPDSFLRIPQSIIVPKGKTAALDAVNRILDELRTSGFLQGAIDRNHVVGVEVAPPGSKTPVAP